MKPFMRHGAFIGLLLTPVAAPAFDLSFPVACTKADECYVQSLVDRDPGPGAADFTCGSLSYDGHKGVDIRVPTAAHMARGVDVLAAAPGVVKGIRDGEPDTGRAYFTKGRDCGNGILIAHDGGWETQYCHLAKGSLAVKTGDQVMVGTRLGQIGLSGNTEFPHLHLSVRKDGIPVDPFDARALTESCSLEDKESLWTSEAAALLAYRPGGVVDGGFAPGPVNLEEIRAGTARSAASKDDARVFWSRFFGLRAGDRISIELIAPDGTRSAENTAHMASARAEHMLFTGKRKPATGWQAGIWRGEAVIWRDDLVFARKTFTFSGD